MSTYETTTSDVIVEAELEVWGDDIRIERAWFVYDPEPSYDINKREARLVKIPIDPKILGRLEREHLIEQAEVSTSHLAKVRL